VSAGWWVLLLAAFSLTGRGRVRWPIVFERVSSRFGPRVHPVTGEQGFHHGIDLAVPRGTLVRAPWAGDCVVKRGEYSGLTVTVRSALGWTCVVMHLDSVFVHTGERVEPGQPLARTGSTGRVTGPHAHLEVRDEAGRSRDPADVFSGFWPVTGGSDVA
jgi:murein DD-endopeptidase MepM/ murein hydrolase activator NlpD